MKTETEIARENVAYFKESDEEDVRRGDCFKHKQTCQRWLEFLEKLAISDCIFGEGVKVKDKIDINEQKITDLKSAIKLYEDAGI